MDIPITLEGKLRLEQELNQLVKVERENIKKAIAEARALGDLKENAEYSSAKEKQSLIEGRIAYLNGVLSRAIAIDVKTIKAEKIVFGANVVLEDLEKNVEISYRIVGEEEADISQGQISYKSPLGQALIGKEEGDTIVVNAPRGKVEYSILSFDYR